MIIWQKAQIRQTVKSCYVSVPRAIPAQENIYDEEGPSSTPSTTADEPQV